MFLNNQQSSALQVISFISPYPTLVLQATNARAKRLGDKATLN